MVEKTRINESETSHLRKLRHATLPHHEHYSKYSSGQCHDQNNFLPWWKILERMLFRYGTNGTERYKLWLQSGSISILKAVLTGAVAGLQCLCFRNKENPVFSQHSFAAPAFQGTVDFQPPIAGPANFAFSNQSKKGFI